MSDPSLEIQGAVVTALKSASAVTALIAGRVYDRVPPAPTFPYVNVGENQVIPDRAGCYDAADVVLTIHAWARGEGYVEVKRVGKAVSDALLASDLPIAGYRLIDKEFEGTRYMRDPDGLTSHAVITFRALTEPSD